MNTNFKHQSPFKSLNLGIIFAIIAGGLLISGIALGLIYQYQRSLSSNSVSIVELTTFHESLGRDHTDYPNIEFNGKPLPRSSGPHSDYSIPFRTYSQTQVDEDQAVHSLEHGGIVIYFDESKISNDEKNQLERLSRTGSYVISPYLGLESKIVVLAWTKSLKLDQVNVSIIQDFYRQWLNDSPEQLA